MQSLILIPNYVKTSLRKPEEVGYIKQDFFLPIVIGSTYYKEEFIYDLLTNPNIFTGFTNFDSTTGFNSGTTSFFSISSFSGS